jgi:tetratricopeptide (TPR) repeat protein
VPDKKWPDLSIMEGEVLYYLECKSLESPKAQSDLLAVEINLLLESMKINADIEILLNNQPLDLASIKSIVAQIRSMLESNNLQKYGENNVDIKITLLEHLQKAPLILPSGFMGGIGDVVTTGAIKKDSDGNIWLKNFNTINIKNKNLPSPKKSILREISKGYKQIRNIPDGALGVICIDISSYIHVGMELNSQDFLAVHEEAVKTINDFFKGPHFKRLSGIILTWNYQKRSPTGSVRVAMNMEVIVHDKSTRPMPKGFLKGEIKPQNMVVTRDISTVMNEAADLFESGRFFDAVDYYDMVTTHYPQMIEGWTYKAVSLIRIKKYPEALGSLKQALAIDSKNRTALDHLYLCYLKLGLIDNASNLIDEMIQLFPNDAFVWYNRAALSYEQGDKENARRYLKKCLEYKSDFQQATALSKKLDEDDDV